MKNNNFQIMRGLCVIAVVLTHIIPKTEETVQYDVLIQNVINIAVAGFIFLSGYFVNRKKISGNPGLYLFDRFKKLLVPYVLWSVFYIAVSLLYGKTYSLLSLIKIFALGQAAGPLYFLVVLMWLTLLTPFIVNRMNNKYWNIIFIAITPVTFLFLYSYQLNIGSVYFTGALLPTSWFIYYYMGLKWQNYTPKLSAVSILLLFVAGYFLELMESKLILHYSTDIQFATTPLRFLPFVYIVPYILYFLKIKNQDKYKGGLLKSLVDLGNCSYGIYLCHVFFLGYVKGAVNYLGRLFHLTFFNIGGYLLYTVIVLIITMLTCLIVIKIFQRFIPRKFLLMIGFA